MCPNSEAVESKDATMLMSDYWHDLHLATSFSGHDAASLGPEYP
jgi:hypothetical protein